MDLPRAQLKVSSLREDTDDVLDFDLVLGPVELSASDVAADAVTAVVAVHEGGAVPPGQGTFRSVLAPNPATRFRSSSLKKVPSGCPSNVLAP